MQITLFMIISETETPVYEFDSTGFVAFYTMRYVFSSEVGWCTVVNVIINLYTELNIILYSMYLVLVTNQW